MTSNNHSSSSSSSGIGFVGLLTIVLITLKLAEIGKVATWSWWWVLSPIWGSLALALVIFVVFAVITLIVTR